ncbi:hypothetical protein BDQ12DRAFT_670364 [Crucibulum laeve]|uniref:Uncharacterized protein n=1 Tax=Crucibulum laeve TaxID=68775 RepID=A0A5C3LLF9_9AGAR|nr:hypothetical protein BDQ12DRAFT_670364 [Crucibulum laeve]
MRKLSIIERNGGDFISLTVGNSSGSKKLLIDKKYQRKDHLLNDDERNDELIPPDVPAYGIASLSSGTGRDVAVEDIHAIHWLMGKSFDEERSGSRTNKKHWTGMVVDDDGLVVRDAAAVLTMVEEQEVDMYNRMGRQRLVPTLCKQTMRRGSEVLRATAMGPKSGS